MKNEQSRNDPKPPRPFAELDAPLPKTITLERRQAPTGAPDRYYVKAEHCGLYWRNITITLEVITPERAAAYLACVPADRRVNRDYKPMNLKRLRAALRAHPCRYLFNGDTLVFNDVSHLIDGKHRLKSCVDENATVVLTVVRGVSQESFATIDTGAPKSFSDMLFVKGHKCTSVLGAAIKIVDEYKIDEEVNDASEGYTPDEAPNLSDKYPELPDSVMFGRMADEYLTTSLGTALHYLFAEKSRVRADQFMEKLATGIGIAGKDDPFYILRLALSSLKGRKKSSSSKNGVNRQTAAAYTVKVWNAVITGGAVKQLKFTDNEKFPKILGLKGTEVGIEDDSVAQNGVGTGLGGMEQPLRRVPLSGPTPPQCPNIT
jgi:hypothetical protein